MTQRPTLRLAALPVLALVLASTAPAAAIDAGDGAASAQLDADLKALEPLLEKYCVRCHGVEEVEAEIDLTGPISQLRLLEERSIWLSVIDQIEFEDMPPKAPLPSADEMATMVDLVNRAVNEVDWDALHDPGRISLARLTAAEYRHAVRDIFGVDLQAGHFLGQDPEGNTGFTNDRDSLSFPLFAFDNFMREAERVVDLWLGYAETPWTENHHLVEVWRRGSDRSVELAADESAVILKERNAPFQVNLDVPFAGVYRLDLEAAVPSGEPISAMHVMINGESVEHVVIRGTRARDYSVITPLAAGANVLSLGFDPDRAPIIQQTFTPRIVPDEIFQLVTRPKVPEFPMPDRFKDNDQAKQAWRKLNNTIRDFELTRRLAEHLIATDQVDYEQHGRSFQQQIRRFGPSKVPFNLAAGSIAVFLEIPQAKLEGQIEVVTGFSHPAYARSAKAYVAALNEKYPERVRRNAGRIALTRATVSSHAVPDGGVSPTERLARAADSDAARETLLRSLATTAFGRPVADAEYQVLDSLYQRTREETGSHREALRDALVGLLVSPAFVIQFTEPASTRDGAISQAEFARRLARFLWLSVPDEPLRAAASGDELNDPKAIGETVDRMIDDPRFGDMTRLFVEQWLDLDNLDQFEDNPSLKTHILAAMREEPARLLHHVFSENRSLLELLDPNYTFLNESLALHYGLADVAGQEMREVALGDAERGGLLTMASILAATSTTERTSPVNRGAFIVELLLGVELPPPPPSVPELNTTNNARTIREELELHREDRACSGCHDRIDPYGFVLEHYDQFGAWRERDRGKPIDASTTLDDGTAIDGLVEFKNYLVRERRDDFVRNLSVRLFEFSLGREMQYSDEAMILAALDALRRDDYRARTLIHAIVSSDAFRMQVDHTAKAKSQGLPEIE